jgi:hypothetical protein
MYFLYKLYIIGLTSIILALAGVTLASPVLGKVSLEAECRYYKSEYETSPWYTLQVDLMTGGELNSATQSYSYNSYSDYAVIWFGKGEAAIVEIENYLMTGSQFSVQDLGTTTTLEGTDEQGVRWEICLSDYCY